MGQVAVGRAKAGHATSPATPITSFPPLFHSTATCCVIIGAPFARLKSNEIDTADHSSLEDPKLYEPTHCVNSTELRADSF